MSISGNLLLPALAFFPMLGALVSWGAGLGGKKDLRALLAEGCAAVEFAALAALFLLVCTGGASHEFLWPGFCGMGLHLRADGFRALYCLIGGLMWLMATLFSRQYFRHYHNRGRYYFFLLMTLGATVGVFLSADLFTTFLFFEIMSFTSYVWVAQDEQPQSLRAAGTYLAVAVVGGLVMLMGLVILYTLFGTLELDLLKAQSAAALADPARRGALYAAGGCLLFGFGAKAGAFPLHIWLPKAHPVAPAPASALLSGILTKAGVFGIVAITVCLFAGQSRWGALILLLGAATMVLGAVLALFSVDLKRTLACSSVSQIGFILVGIAMAALLGAENTLAARGALLHMVNHSLLKLVLFLCAGVVFLNIHKLDLNEIRGFGRGKPLLNFAFLMGALGIGGIPLWNGYVSKTLIHESIVEYRALLAAGEILPAGGSLLDWLLGGRGMACVEWLFLLSGGFTVAYMTKLYAALFLEKNANAAVQAEYDALNGRYLTGESAFALVGGAVLLPLLGAVPHLTSEPLARLGEAFLGSAGAEEAVAFFSLESLQGALVSLVVGAILYAVVVRGWMMARRDGGTVYVDRWPRWLDLENLIYRPLLLKVLPLVGGVVFRFLDRLLDGIIVLLRKTIYRDSPLPFELEEGNRLTYALGGLLDSFCALFHNRTNYRHRLALLYADLSEHSMVITRSLSFGLFMACLGLILLLLYLLL